MPTRFSLVEEEKLPTAIMELLELYGGEARDGIEANPNTWLFVPAKTTAKSRFRFWTVFILALLLIVTGVTTFVVFRLREVREEEELQPLQLSEISAIDESTTSSLGEPAEEISSTLLPFMVVGVNPIPATNWSTMLPLTTTGSDSGPSAWPTQSPTLSIDVNETTGFGSEALMSVSSQDTTGFVPESLFEGTNQSNSILNPESSTAVDNYTESTRAPSQEKPSTAVTLTEVATSLGNGSESYEQIETSPISSFAANATPKATLSSVPTTALTETPTTDGPNSSPTSEALLEAPTLAPSRDMLAPTSFPTFVTIYPAKDLLPEDVFLFDFLVAKSLDEGVQLRNHKSPQYNAFRWLSGNLYLSSYSDEVKIQRFAMACIFFSTNGNEWTNNQNWLSDQDECEWFSRVAELPIDAVCDIDHHVITLDLDYNNLQGQLPGEISLLRRLRRIGLYGGPQYFLTGSVPQELGTLSLLESLSLRGNQFSGSIPELGKCTSLHNLNLSQNRFTGVIPSSVGMLTQMTSLNLATNRLTSQLPTEIGQLERLQFLTAGSNSLNGPLPTQLGLLTVLRGLDLEMNSLSTSLPTQLGLLPNLGMLHLTSSKLLGSLPTEIGVLSALHSLKLRGNGLISSIPTEIGLLSNLQGKKKRLFCLLGFIVVVRDPDRRFAFASSTGSLDLSFNRLSGAIPSELGRASMLLSLFLNSNQLSGRVPEAIYKLSRLNTLRIEENNISGSVPVAVCQVFSVTLPVFYADCTKQIACKCCTYCCIDNAGCACEHTGTLEEFLC